MSSFTLKWGIIGTGWMSSMFVADLFVERESDVKHSITAVGSRDPAKAQEFVDKHVPEKSARAAVYDDVFNAKDVDIIYVGTLHHMHHRDASAALNAGKHVLVEKPACLNSAEWDDLYQLAKSKGLFLMEGLWTRFLPSTEKLIKLLHEDKVIGNILAVKADFSMPFYKHFPDSHRALNPETAGGPLLDLGPYVVFTALEALYMAPENEGTAPTIRADMIKGRTGVDLTTSLVLEFAKTGGVANLVTSFNYMTPKDNNAVIVGDKGSIAIHTMVNRPTKFTITRETEYNGFFPKAWDKEELEVDFAGVGFYFEADAAARSIRDGQTEQPLWTGADTKLMLNILDTARTTGGYVYPKGLETVLP